MRCLATFFVAIAAFVLSAAFSPKETRASDVVVFAAASLKNAMDQVGGAFAAETGMSVTFSYAGTATLARQIEQGAPADLIAAAHPVWIDYLAERGLIEPGSAVDFASNRLVLIAPKEAAATTDEPLSGVLLELPELLEAAGGNARLATAVTDAVPAGIYAREALQALSVWEELEPRLAQADNVRAALQFVARREAPLGIVYASDADAEPRVRTLSVVEPDLHSPIRYTIAIVAPERPEGAAKDAALSFLEFLVGDASADILAESGFLAPVEQ